MPPLVGLSLMPHDDFRQTIQPLLDEHLIDVIEWSVEMGWGRQPLPAWCAEVLSVYGECDRLLGHGVHYSLLSAQIDSQPWLTHFNQDPYRYRHITEHFGWMVAGGFTQGAPFPLMMTSATVALGQERMRKLAGIAQIPVGLENLAFAFHRQDALIQGRFLTELIAPVDGFVLLDLHNLYCQMCNFQLSAEEILATYPLDRVREIHLSGGSWSHHGGQVVRRDTHNQAIPEAVFDLLTIVLKRCPHIDFVIAERLGQTLNTESERQQFRQQFQRIHDIVEAQSVDPVISDVPLWAEMQPTFVTELELSDDDVARFQREALNAFYGHSEIESAIALLKTKGLNPTLEQYLLQAEPKMLELAGYLVKKWSVLSA